MFRKYHLDIKMSAYYNLKGLAKTKYSGALTDVG